MKKALFTIVSLLLFSGPQYAQNTSWIKDSLAYYRTEVAKAIQSDEYQKVLDWNNVIYAEASKTLEPEVYQYYYDLAENQKIQKEYEVLANVYNDVGNLEFYRGRYKDARVAFNYALTNFTKAKKEKNAAGMAMNLGVLLEREGAYDSAIHNYETAKKIFQQINDTSNVANCLENIALAYQEMDNISEALSYMDKVEHLLTHSIPKNDGRWINYYYNKGLIFKSDNLYDSALFYSLKGLRLSEELGNPRTINTGYRFMIGIYKKVEDFANWKKYALLSRQFAHKTENHLSGSEFTLSLSSYYLTKGNYDSASYYATESIELAKKADSKHALRDAKILLSNIYNEQGDYEKSIAELQEVLTELSTKDISILAGIYHNLGSAYLALNKLDKSDEYLLKSLDYRKQFQNKFDLMESYQTLSQNSKKKGDFKSAFEYFTLAKQYEDSIFNETKMEQIAEMQTEYETEKKDQEIASLAQLTEIQQLKTDKQQSQIYLILSGLALVLVVAGVFYNRSRIKNKANQLLAQKNAEIEKQHGEKEMLLKEIHHRVKNNLQIISSLLSMQTRSESDAKVISAMNEGQSRVKTMALIHEKLYQYDNLSRINMHEYMEQLSAFLAQTYRSDKKIDIQIEAEDINLDIDVAVPLGLITNELLSNSLKYAFQEMDQGLIKIILSKREENGYKLTVSDTGKGISKELDIDKTKSLGLKLVRTLTRQISGKLSVATENGATFSIEFEEPSIAA